MKICRFCKRELNNPEDPLSADCGGDCAYCMIREEVDIGAYHTAMILCLEMAIRIAQINRKEINELYDQAR